MPSVVERIYHNISGHNVLVNRLDKSWSVSPRIGGKLQLRPNAYSLRRALFEEWSVGRNQSPMANQPSLSPTGAEYDRAAAKAYAQAYARLRGKLYDGSASLGVTLGSLQQSRDMITARTKTLRTESVELVARAFGAKRKGKDASGLILETFFGWVPLFSDIHSAVNSVIQLADALTFVRGSGKAQWQTASSFNNGFHSGLNQEVGTAYSTYAAGITIINPNRWLMERAGLLNYAAVAWDLVPWSFMVNAFSNTGGLVNSLTDFAGLQFQNATITTKWDFRTTNVRTSIWKDEDFGQSSRSVSRSRGQDRVLSGPPVSPSLVWRMPELNFTTAAIGLSLVVQNFAKLRPFYTLGHMTLSKFRRSGG